MSLLDIFRVSKIKAENAELWKVIDKLKKEHSDLLTENERLRQQLHGATEEADEINAVQQRIESFLDSVAQSDIYADTDVLREPHTFPLLTEQAIPGFDFSEVFEIRTYNRNLDKYFDTYYLCPNMAETVRKRWEETYPKIVAALSEQGRNKEISCYDLRPGTLHFDSKDKESLCSRKLCELRVTPKTPTGKKPKYPFSVRIEGYNRQDGLVLGILYFLYDGTIGRVEVSSTDMGMECSGFSKTF